MIKKLYRYYFLLIWCILGPCDYKHMRNNLAER